MSFLYSILKPIVRKLVKERGHQEESYEDFVRVYAKYRQSFDLSFRKSGAMNFGTR